MLLYVPFPTLPHGPKSQRLLMALALLVGPGEGLPWGVTCHPQDSFTAAAQGGLTLTHSGWGSWPLPGTGR